MIAYYNEIDPYAAQWLRNLIKAGHIAPGDVDERSIVDVRPAELAGYTQCHFFAGIGGWSLALRLAGWDDDRPVWSGSCPCQPFSAAGKGKAADDERHLWPAWFSLIRELCPPVVFGEQVEAAIGWGWVDAVFADLEQEGYACGATVFPSCSVGAPHIRQRLWFVADAGSAGSGRDASTIPGAEGKSEGARIRLRRIADELVAYGATGKLADAYGGHAGAEGLQRGGQHGQQPEDGRTRFWKDATWLPCTDGKARPIEPGSFPLAHGVSGRVAVRRTRIEAETEISEEHWYSRTGAIRGLGNAINPWVAAEFIKAVM